jgi:uncharacterized membrane protein YraQ (UPF0718 family)
MGRGRIPGGWLFLALVVAAHGVTAAIAPDRAQTAVAIFLPMLGRVAPILLVVLALMLLSERFLTAQRVERWLGPDSGLRGWLLAATVGAIATGPVYAWYALLAELRLKGMRTGLLATLLYARAIKLPLLPLMAHYFGLRYTLILSAWMLVFAFLNGFVMERLEPCSERKVRPPSPQ